MNKQRIRLSFDVVGNNNTTQQGQVSTLLP